MESQTLCAFLRKLCVVDFKLHGSPRCAQIRTASLIAVTFNAATVNADTCIAVSMLQLGCSLLCCMFVLETYSCSVVNMLKSVIVV